MLELFKIVGQIALDGVDAVEQGIEGVDSKAAELTTRLNRTGDALQKVGDKVTSVGGSMTKWVTGPLAAAATGVGLLANKAADYTRDLDRMAQVANTTTQEFQRQAYAVSSVGIESDKYADILKDMNDRVGDFIQTGGGPMADFFENIAPKVGVTAEQFRGLSGPDALQLYVDSLEKANVSQEDMTFYMEAIASDSTALLPLLRNNGQAMKEMGDEAQRSGLILSEETLAATRAARGDMAKFGQAIDVITVQLGSALIPVLESLIPVLIDVVVPAAKTFAGVLEGWITVFNALPEPLQSLIVVLVGLAGAIGPVLLIVGKMITTIGAMTKAFAAMRVAALALSPSLVPIIAALSPFIAIAAAVAAGLWVLWEAVNAVAEAFGGWDAVFRKTKQVFNASWDAIKAGFTAALEFVQQGIQRMIQFFTGLWQQTKQVLATMVDGVANLFSNMVSAAINSVKSMVSRVVSYVKNMAANVVNSIKEMFMAVVGNSIIPDMAAGVLDEFAGMTDGAVKDTEALVKGVNGTLDGINGNVAPTVEMSGSGGRTAAGGANGGGVNVDMRHAIIRDDKDMLDRMRRSGLEMTGAF